MSFPVSNRAILVEVPYPLPVSISNPAVTAAKEVIALNVLLKLGECAHFEAVIEGGQALTTYRHDLYWKLIQPHGSITRNECWKWVLMIAEQFSSLFVRIMKFYVDEAQKTLAFLKDEDARLSQEWSDLAMPDADYPSKDWGAQNWEHGVRMAEMKVVVAHHCTVLELTQQLLTAYEDNDDEARKIIREL